MGYAVCISFDEQTDACIKNTWQRLAQQNIPSPLHGSTYQPHVTLGVFETTKPTDFIRRLSVFSDKCSPYKITFTSVDFFAGKTTTIYAKIESSDKLHQVHIETHRILGDITTSSRKLYQPGSWIPHCTLGWRIGTTHFNDFMNTCREMPFPIEGQATKLWVFDDAKEVEIITLMFGNDL